MSDFRRLLPASGIRKIFDRAQQLEKQGRKILHLEIGRPDWPLALAGIEAAKLALDRSLVHYIANRGLPELRETLSRRIARSTGRVFDPDREIIVTLGASEGLSMCTLALLDRGDEAIIPVPSWNHYSAAVEMAGAAPVELQLRAENGFQLDPDELKKLVTPRTRLLVLNTPGNPSGAVQSGLALKEIVEFTSRKGIYILSDEVYDLFTYGSPHVSPLSFAAEGAGNIIYLNSLSKSCCMTGWRIGYVAAAAEVSDALNRVHQYLTVCGVPFAQKGAADFLNDPSAPDWMEGMRKEFRQRRDIWLQVMDGCEGFRCVKPEGAFYLFPEIRFRGLDGYAFCEYALEEHGLAFVPGGVFGAGFDRHIRISYGLDIQTQKDAAATLKRILES